MILIKILFIIIFIYGVFVLIKNTFRNKNYLYPKTDPIKLGHRGYPKKSVENTIESFQEALDSELDGVELDVQLTLDKKIIVYHNWDIETENGKFELIKNLSYEKISNIAGKLNYEVPLLIEVIKLIKNKCIINIEIKSLSYTNSTIEQSIIDLINLYNITANCIVSSFNPLVIRRIKKIDPDIHTAFLWTKNNSQLIFNTPIWIQFCIPNSIHVDINLLDDSLIQWARRKNLSIMVFTITNQKEFEKAKSFNVDGVIIEQQNLITF